MSLTLGGAGVRPSMVAALVALLALAGCSSSSDDDPTETPAAPSETSETSGSSSEPAAETSETGAFPVTLDTAYGEITVPEKPERIVVFSARNIELLSLLGEEPYAWNNGDLSREEQLATGSPWLEDVITIESDTSLYDMGEYALNPEAFAQLEPDLILADVWNVNEQVYEQLSQVAPTFVGLETDAWTSWQDTLASFATLTGHDPDAAVADAEASLAAASDAAAERLPGLQGATYQVPAYNQEGGFGLARWDNRVFENIGLVPGEGQESAEMTTVSRENIDALNADVLFVSASGSISAEAREEGFTFLREDPRFPELPASQNGTVVFLSAVEYAAINAVTPASVTWWLDQVVPQLEESTLNQSGR